MLVAVRDHSGECPLYFHDGPDFFALASAPKGLRTLPGVGRRLNEKRLSALLMLGFADRNASFFEGITRLPPGHLVRVTVRGVEVREYWHPSHAPSIRLRRDAEYAECLLEIFDAAVRPRLRTTGGLASQLSSGLDSSSVTSSAATLLGHQGRALRAYTMVPQQGFSDESFSVRAVNDEGPFAAELAAMYPNVTHVPLSSRGLDLVECLREGSWLLDEPVTNGLNLMWFWAFFYDARRHGVSTMLQGAMGNATFSFEHMGVLSDFFRRGRWVKLARHALTLRSHGEASGSSSLRAALSGFYPRALDRAAREGQRARLLDGIMVQPEFARLHRMEEHLVEWKLRPFQGMAAERREFFEWFDFGSINAGCGVLLRHSGGAVWNRRS